MKRASSKTLKQAKERVASPTKQFYESNIRESVGKNSTQIRERVANPARQFYENNIREPSSKLIDHGKKLPSELGVKFNKHVTKPTKAMVKENITDPVKKTFKSGTKKAAKALMICSFLGGAGYATVHSIRIFLSG